MIIERRPLSVAIIEHLVENDILVDVGVNPVGGGWIGQPNANGSNFTPYSTIIPMPSSQSEGGISANAMGVYGPQSEWRLPYGFNSYGVSPAQAEWMADKSRGAIVTLKDTKIDMSRPCVVIWVSIDVVGALTRNDATEPPYWGQQDTITFWLSEE